MHYRPYIIYSLTALQNYSAYTVTTFRSGACGGQASEKVPLPSHIAKSLDLFLIQSLVYIDPLVFPDLHFGGIGPASLCVSTPHTWGGLWRKYAPVVKFTSVRAMLATVAVQDLELHQTDVVTSFLNGDIDKDIYVEVTAGIKHQSRPNLVRKFRGTLRCQASSKSLAR